MEIIMLPILDRDAVLTAYLQAPSREMQDAARKPAMLVLPGGAYMFTSDREAEPVALAYAAEGFQAFVLHYSTGADAVGCQPLREVEEAISIIRENASQWHINPSQITVCGFSAGGHLAAWVGLTGKIRPDAVILGYAATTLYTGEPPDFIVKALLGESYTHEQAKALNLSGFVDGCTPPIFCWTTSEDAVVDARQTLDIAVACSRAGRPFELHVFQRGEHGLSLAKSVTASGRLAMTDAQAAFWYPLSIRWLTALFGLFPVEDKPYQRPDWLPVP